MLEHITKEELERVREHCLRKGRCGDCEFGDLCEEIRSLLSCDIYEPCFWDEADMDRILKITKEV